MPITGLVRRRTLTREITREEFDGNYDAIEAAVDAQTASIAATGWSGIVDFADSGADPTGVVDATSLFNSYLLTAKANGRSLALPPGTFKVSTIRVPSQVEMFGSRGRTIIKSDGSNAPIVVSANYVASSGQAVEGRMHLRDFIIQGNNDQTKSLQHGLLIRDHTAEISNLEIIDVGGAAIKLSHTNDASTAATAGTLVRNVLRHIRVRNCRGAPAIDLGALDNPCLLDGVIQDVELHTHRVSAAAYIQMFCGNALGWVIDNIRVYAAGASTVIPATGLDIRRPWHALISGINVGLVTTHGVYLQAQTGITQVRDVHVRADSFAAGGAAFYGDAYTGQLPHYAVDSVDLTRDTGSTAAYAVRSNNGATVSLARPPIVANGSNISRYGPIGSGVLRVPNGAGGWTNLTDGA